MKSSVYTILILIFILSSFNVLGAAFIDHNENQACPFALVSNNDCEVVAGGATLVLHHVTGLKMLTESLQVSVAGVVLVSLLVVASLYAGRFFALRIGLNQAYRRQGDLEMLFVFISDPILKWLALHNKRGTHLMFGRAIV